MLLSKIFRQENWEGVEVALQVFPHFVFVVAVDFKPCDSLLVLRILTEQQR